MKNMVMMMCFTFMAALSAHALLGPMQYNIEELSAAPVIDGNGSDAAWSSLAPVWLCDVHTTDTNTATTAEDHSAKFRAGWLGDTLYMLFEVTDDAVDFSNAAHYQEDSVEIYLDLHNREASTSANATAWTDNGGPIQFRCQVVGSDFTPLFNCGTGSADATAFGASYVCVVSGTTHTYEIAIPATTAGLGAGNTELGDITTPIGFCLSPNDAESGSRQNQLWWFGGDDVGAGNFNTAGARSIVAAFGSTAGDWGSAKFVAAGEGGLVSFDGGGEGEGEGETGCTYLEDLDASGDTLQMFVDPATPWIASTADWTHQTPGTEQIPSSWELAMLAAAMCNGNAELIATYEANLVAALASPPLGVPGLAALGAGMSTLGPNYATFWMASFGLSGQTGYPGGVLESDGDYDGDGYTNKEEYDFIVAQGGTRADFAEAATGGYAGPGVPVAGLLGLGLVSIVCAINGAVIIRKKK